MVVSTNGMSIGFFDIKTIDPEFPEDGVCENTGINEKTIKTKPVKMNRIKRPSPREFIPIPIN